MARSTSPNPLPEKTCAACGRRMTWRRRWARNWAEVKYCSRSCRSRRTGDGDRSLEAAIRELLGARSRDASICPSEAARTVDPGDWRRLMEPARGAARRMAARGELVFRQGGRTVDPSTAKGPVRLARGPSWQA